MFQMGISDMEAMDAMVYGDLEDDAELEAELAALEGRDPSPRPAKKGTINHVIVVPSVMISSQ